MRSLTIILLLLLSAANGWGATTRATIFLDGAIVEREIQVSRRYLELALPATMQSGSLRVRYEGKGSLSRVEIGKAKPDRRREKELLRLTGQREQLRDRLRVLAVKEDIFAAAAKSQSSKTPRKTKNDPDPLASIRQGSDFALAQLETVYKSRRRTEAELKGVDERFSLLNNERPVSLARIWLTGQSGRLIISWQDNGLHLRPVYEYHLSGADRLDMQIAAELSSEPDLDESRLILSRISDPSAQLPPFRQAVRGVQKISREILPLLQERFSPTPLPSLSFTYRNSTGKKLPAGIAACYRQGVYLGAASSGELSTGGEQEVSCGR